MQLPSDLLVTQLIPTLGAANVQQVSPTFAAPGVGLRYRVWYWTGTLYAIADAPTKVEWIADDTVATIGWLSTVGRAAPVWGPPGGFRAGDNKGLRGLTTADVANCHVVILAYYTIEAVS